MDEQQLLRIKNKFEQLEEQNKTNEIKKGIIMENLKDNWGVNSIKEAEAKLTELKTKVSNLDKEFDEKFKNFIEELKDLDIL